MYSKFKHQNWRIKLLINYSQFDVFICPVDSKSTLLSHMVGVRRLHSWEPRWASLLDPVGCTLHRSERRKRRRCSGRRTVVDRVRGRCCGRHEWRRRLGAETGLVGGAKRGDVRPRDVHSSIHPNIQILKFKRNLNISTVIYQAS